MKTNEESTAQRIDGSSPRPRDARGSGLRPRVDASTLAAARERRVLRTMLEVAESLRSARTLRLAFRAVIPVMEKLFPLRAVALVPLEARDRPCIWCASRRDLVLAEVEALSASVRAWVTADGADSFDPLAAAATSRLRWMLLPIVADDQKVVGMFAVSTADGVFDESRVAFVACVAANITPFVARTQDVSPAAEERDDPLEDRAHLLVDDLTTYLFDSLDYVRNLRHIARVLSAETRGACVVRIDAPAEQASDGQRGGATYITTMEANHDVCVLDALLDRASASGSPLPVTDRACVDAACSLRAAWVFVVPMQTIRGRVGALALVGPSGTDSRPFPIDLAEVLAQRAATAIENGRAYEEAMRALKRRDDLLSTVSHDLKNPLAVISLSAARMLEEPPEVDPVNGRRRVVAIQRSAVRMGKLVSDLLDLTAADAGALSMRPCPVAPSVLVADAVEGHASLAADAGIHLVGATAERLGPVWADRDRIHQVLSNLIGNAIKFTPRGGLVSVGARSHYEMVAISVADTGCGIPESDLERVFDRHWQGSHLAKPGSGLGLAICKSIVELQGGRLVVESEVDVGSTFTFTLPLAQGPALHAARLR